MEWSMFVWRCTFLLATNKQYGRDIFGFITPNNSIFAWEIENWEKYRISMFSILLPIRCALCFLSEDPNICINITNDPISIVSVAIDLSGYQEILSCHVIFEIVSTFTQRSFCINICGAVFWFSKNLFPRHTTVWKIEKQIRFMWWLFQLPNYLWWHSKSTTFLRLQ